MSREMAPLALERRQTDAADYARAMLNILSDVDDDKARLQDTQRAVINILDDAASESRRLLETQQAVLNILDDAAIEKAQLEATQRAVLNILEDVDAERSERRHAEAQVRALNEGLEARVLQRTAELTAANQELETFAYSVSHDLRAPLRSIDGFSQALLEDYGERLDEEGRDNLHRVREASQRMGQLIDDMLKLSRATRGETAMDAVDVSGLVALVAADLRRASPERAVEVSITPGIVAQTDGRMLRAVLENLLSNAWKFTAHAQAPSIAFAAENRNGELVCAVRDNGAGFDMAYAGNLFKPFQRLHRPNEFPGNGIGLATVQRILARLGGRVWATGAVNAGATFFFALPDTSIQKD
jgi:light-regulated signal transduction histidine kinase (bacteriophytochrome)